MPPLDDPLLAKADRLLDASAPGVEPEALLLVALQLEGARRRLRARALELSRRELALAARERELRERLAQLASPRRSA